MVLMVPCVEVLGKLVLAVSGMFVVAEVEGH
jgi:hypothetical protein